MSERIDFSKLSDTELIDRFRYSHDNRYVGELYLRYAHLVLGLCINYFKDKDKAQDATMSIFEILLRELKRHKIEHFKSWLYTVSKNYCLQELRKSNSTREKNEVYKKFYLETMEISSEEPLNTEKEEWLTKLNDALNKIKHNQQVCLRLFYLENKSYADIAEETNYSLKEVKSYIQNGKRNLKIKMEDKRA